VEGVRNNKFSNFLIDDIAAKVPFMKNTSTFKLHEVAMNISKSQKAFLQTPIWLRVNSSISTMLETKCHELRPVENRDVSSNSSPVPIEDPIIMVF